VLIVGPGKVNTFSYRTYRRQGERYRAIERRVGKMEGRKGEMV
jgi:hypothetical protein